MRENYVNCNRMTLPPELRHEQEMFSESFYILGKALTACKCKDKNCGCTGNVTLENRKNIQPEWEVSHRSEKFNARTV